MGRILKESERIDKTTDVALIFWAEESYFAEKAGCIENEDKNQYDTSVAGVYALRSYGHRITFRV